MRPMILLRKRGLNRLVTRGIAYRLRQLHHVDLTRPVKLNLLFVVLFLFFFF